MATDQDPLVGAINIILTDENDSFCEVLRNFNDSILDEEDNELLNVLRCWNFEYIFQDLKCKYVN